MTGEAPGGATGKDEGVESVSWARELARRLLGSEQRRLAHSEAVGRRAEEISSHVPVDLRSDFISAAFLHDIGYSPAVERTGFHPLDGASYLAERGLESIAALVAHHSASGVEAELRGLSASLCQFDNPDPVAADALTYCDVTTGPDGDWVTVDQRLRDIRDRYEPEEPLRISVDRAEADLRAAVLRVEERLESQVQSNDVP